jgi:hypothetical protein
MKMKYLAATLVLAFAMGGPALAYSQADADACTPDAMKLCSKVIPDKAKITSCLQQNRSQLSPACSAVMSAKPKSKGHK